MSAVPAATPVGTTTAPKGSPELILSDLYERYSDRIYRFCARQLRTRDEAEDALQTTFLYALRALRRGVVPLSESAWLYKIAENVCHSARRTRGRRSEHELVAGSELLDRVPARNDNGDALLGLRAALDSLPGGQRNAFVLRELHGLSYREIAAELGVSVASVEALLFRARGGIARGLEDGVGLRARLRTALDLGSLLGAVKAAFAGAGAVKLAAATAVVVVATVPAGDASPASVNLREPSAPAATVPERLTAVDVSRPSRAEGNEAAVPAAKRLRHPAAVAPVRHKPSVAPLAREQRKDSGRTAQPPSDVAEAAPASAPSAPAELPQVDPSGSLPPSTTPISVPVTPPPALPLPVPPLPAVPLPAVPLPVPPISSLPEVQIPDPLELVPPLPPLPLPVPGLP